MTNPGEAALAVENAQLRERLGELRALISGMAEVEARKDAEIARLRNLLDLAGVGHE